MVILINVALRQVRIDHARLAPRIVSGARGAARRALAFRPLSALRISGGRQRTVVVAVVAVRMMEVAADAVVQVVAVGNCLVTAAGAVHMAGIMTAAAMIRGAAIGVVGGDVDHVLVDMISMRMVEVTIVQVVDMPAVPHGGVPAIRTVLVSVVRMVGRGASSHRGSSFPCPGSAEMAVRPSAAWSIALRTNGNTCSSARA